MPNVVGLEYEAALASMVTAGVRVIPLGYFQADPVALVWVKSAAKTNVVTDQSPISGASVAANSAATLTVSAPIVSVAYPAGGTNT
jgi:beta-lactam-binding protein with PASTA domain